MILISSDCSEQTTKQHFRTSCWCRVCLAKKRKIKTCKEKYWWHLTHLVMCGASVCETVLLYVAANIRFAETTVTSHERQKTEKWKSEPFSVTRLQGLCVPIAGYHVLLLGLGEQAETVAKQEIRNYGKVKDQTLLLWKSQTTCVPDSGPVLNNPQLIQINGSLSGWSVPNPPFLSRSGLCHHDSKH